MKWRVPFLTAGLFAISGVAHAEVIEIYVTEVPYRDPGPMFLLLGAEFLGDVPLETEGSSARGEARGFSVAAMSARERDFQLQVGVGFRQIDFGNLQLPSACDCERTATYLDAIIGARYFSRAPTMLFAKTLSVRFSAAGQAALSIGDAGMDFPITVSGGLAFSRRDDPSGILVELAHRPTTVNVLAGSLDVDPYSDVNVHVGTWTGLRASVFFGP